MTNLIEKWTKNVNWQIIKEEIQNCIQKVAKHYDAKSVLLENIEKEGGHPNQKGMEQMANQIEKVLI